MKVLIAMSGGVDSSAAALLTIEQGYTCVGCTMKLYQRPEGTEPDENSRSCCTLDDAEDARSVARKLGMPFYVFNYTDEFREKVILPFAECYLRGETPNPCIECNRHLKFDALLRKAEILGCDKLVTGHYARIEADPDHPGEYLLKKALDSSKDQSYVLYMLTQEQLRHLIFPLGSHHKTDIRALAAANGFVNADKPDSQDICFVENHDHTAAIRAFTGKTAAPGSFVDMQGKVLGPHQGITRYTVGQHRGLGIDLSGKRYVCSINPEENTIVLGTRAESCSSEALLKNVSWVSGRVPEAPVSCSVKVRYRQKETPAVVIPLPEGGARIEFPEPQWAVTPGQTAVFYDGDIVLGGGTITRS